MGQFWLKILPYERGNIPHVKVSYVQLLCQHCKNASCISACPYGAIIQRDDGLVIIDPNTCVGCRICLSADACPYGVIYFNTDLLKAQKCTGCAHLVDRGWPINGPRCADVCGMEAIKFGEDTELDLSGTEILHPEYGLSPRVHYIGLPKRFVAGTVYDSIKEEIIKDATCTATGPGGSFTGTTDAFGDFYLDGLESGKYTLTINATGYTAKTQEIDLTEKDLGLPDIALA